MDDKELQEKLSKLSPEQLKIVDTYVDYLLYKIAKQETVKNQNTAKGAKSKDPGK